MAHAQWEKKYSQVCLQEASDHWEVAALASHITQSNTADGHLVLSSTHQTKMIYVD
jgi:hypothetical protein